MNGEIGRIRSLCETSILLDPPANCKTNVYLQVLLLDSRGVSYPIQEGVVEDFGNADLAR